MGQSQKYMMYIMPFFALSGLYWPFGLVLYWVTTNLWTLGQQYLLFRRFPQPAAAGAAGAAAPAIAPTVTAKPKRSAALPPGSGTAGSPADQDKPAGAARSSDGAAQSNGAARSDGAARRNANGAQPRRSSRKAADAPAGRSAGQGAQPSANGGGAGGMLRRLGKGRAEPEPQPSEPEVKLVRQQKQRQSRSKRSGKR
jgi:hypothetical protein